MDHIVTKHIINHLEDYSILYDLQLSSRSLMRNSAKIIHPELHYTNNSNIQTSLIIMDFAKAFDEIPHLRRLYKLESEDNL